MLNVSNSSQSGHEESTDMLVFSVLLVYYIVGTVGVIANGFICVIIFGYTTMYKSCNNYLVISQSVIDGIACGFMILKAVGLQFMPEYFPGVGGQILCKVWYSDLFVVASAISSTYNSVSLTVERFIKLHFPLKHKAMISKSKLCTTVVCVVVVSFVYSCGTNVATTIVESDTCMPVSYWPNYQLQVFGNVTIFTVEFCIPLLIFVICYSSMYKVVRGLTFHNESSKSKPNEDRSVTQAIRVWSAVSTSQSNSLQIEAVNQNAVTSSNDSGIDTKGQERRDKKYHGPKVYFGNEVTMETPADNTPANQMQTGPTCTKPPRKYQKQNTLTTVEVSTISRLSQSDVTLPTSANHCSAKTYRSWSSAEKNILKTVALINCSFILFWAPVEIYFFGLNVSMFSPPSQYADMLQIILISLVQFNFIVNPVIYSFNLKEIRNGISKAFSSRNAVDPYFN